MTGACLLAMAGCGDLLNYGRFDIESAAGGMSAKSSTSNGGTSEARAFSSGGHLLADSAIANGGTILTSDVQQQLLGGTTTLTSSAGGTRSRSSTADGGGTAPLLTVAVGGSITAITSTPAEPPQRKAGISVSWSYLSNPFEAKSIAVCNPTGNANLFYAHNESGGLFKGNGLQDGWHQQGVYPDILDFACTNTGELWALRASTDSVLLHPIWTSIDEGRTFTLRFNNDTLMSIGAGALVVGLDKNGVVCINDGGTSGWLTEPQFPGAATVNVALIDNGQGRRWFILKDGDIQFTDDAAGALSPLTLYDGNNQRQPVRDFATTDARHLWALSESRNLYQAAFQETACQDGVDNDQDGVSDGHEPDCYSRLGDLICAQYKTDGNYCISRLGIASNTLVSCSSGTRTKTVVLDTCRENQTLGRDY